jgi:hypothetical protein
LIGVREEQREHLLGRRFILRPKMICVWMVLSLMAFSSKFWKMMAFRAADGSDLAGGGLSPRAGVPLAGCSAEGAVPCAVGSDPFAVAAGAEESAATGVVVGAAIGVGVDVELDCRDG